MTEMKERGSALAVASLCFATIALFASPILSSLALVYMVNTGSSISALLMSYLIYLKPVGGLVAVICGHIARRKFDIQLSPQKSAIALAGIIIGYASIIEPLSGTIIAVFAVHTLKGM